MDLPRKYPYESSLKLLVAFFVLACILVLLFVRAARHPESGLSLVPVLMGWPGAVLFYWQMAGIALAVAVLQGMRLVQRNREHRFLKLREEDLVLPYGYFHVSDLSLPYTAIERVWQGKLFEKPVLYVRSGGRTLSIRPGRLPGMESYVEIREFLYSKVKLRRPEGGPGLG